MKISIIAAMTCNRLIGNQNQLPWHLPADLKHFKTMTWGKPIIMGRKTYQSIGKALPGRTNIVITRDPTFTAKNCLVAHSIKAACQLATNGEGEQCNQSNNEALAKETTSCMSTDEVFIIGGANIYQQALDLADKLYITLVNGEFNGDCYFPAWSDKQWTLVAQEKHQADPSNQYGYTFLRYEKNL